MHRSHLQRRAILQILDALFKSEPLPVLPLENAFHHSGTGSTKVRARDIDAIYRSAAPLLSEIVQQLPLGEIPFSSTSTAPTIVITSVIDHFTAQVIEMLEEAIQVEGGKMVKI